MKRYDLVTILALLILVLVACGGAPSELSEVTLVLDWVPNTNHTGIFVAQEKGYFEEAGLAVEIIQPGEVYAYQLVATGQAELGISFQEEVTLARAEGLPVVSIGAIIQHNSSGFAALSEKEISTPADFEGLRYGAWPSAFEEPILQGLMECAGGDFSQLEIVTVGWADPLALLDEEQIDLAWIFAGWQGFQAEQQGIDLDVVMMEDYIDCIPDYYTPVFIASEEMISQQPETLRALMGALSQGYVDAIANPAEAAEMLLRAAPELDRELVVASQAWLSPRYQADAPRWGEQKLAIWERYIGWVVEQGIIEAAIGAQDAFTNEFLP